MQKINKLSRGLIHKDLNHSNILWPDRFTPKIIDLETLGNSIRINDFVSPLLFLGNMAKPEYLLGGIGNIVNAYDKTSRIPLSEDEKIILPHLLKYSTLMNYVIRKIRRNGIEEEYLTNTKENLIKLNLEIKR